VEQVLLKGSGDLRVRDHFRFRFGETTGLGVQAPQAACVKTGWSQNSTYGRRHQVESVKGLATRRKVLWRH
jgi:hypothetical protein